MKLAGLALAVGLVAALHHTADAMCGSPYWVGTPDGATIPQTGSLYVYDHDLPWAKDDALAAKGPIVKKTRISERVVRLDYATKADELELTHSSYSPVFQVSATWKPPAAAPRVIQYWHHKTGFTCSPANGLMLQIDQPTAAFRVYWQSGDRPVMEMIVPAQTDEHNVNVLALGQLECTWVGIEPEELAAGGKLVVMAIRFDGSEVAVAGVPDRISIAQMPKSEEGLGRAIGFPAGTEPTQPVPTHKDHDWPFHMFLLLLIPTAALLYIALRDRSVKAVV